ncbi:MAG: ABC transporter ATP-binding protein [Fimbriimonadaceae bacterium]|nr:ABC transporter ATP-binding protein [Fimbriimonadaceae bacterium]
MSPAALLSAVEVGRRFGDRVVLRRVSFELTPGMILAVTGSNGRGKSTLLKIAAGLLEPTSGRMICRAKRSCSALDLQVYADLTAAEHIEWWSGLAGLRTDPREVLANVGLTGAENTLGRSLSTGMRARLKLALARLDPPDVLILDEPTAGLDDAGRALILEAVTDASRRGAVLLATNDRDDLEMATHELPL